jgi:hypothetical protein
MDCMHCADGSDCWKPECCSSGMPCLKWVSRQPEPGPPEPFTIDLDPDDWKPIASNKELG